MSLMTDVAIKKALGRDIVIEPFSKDCLTPVGYDLSVGDFVFSLEQGLIEPVDSIYQLPPKNTVQIMTNESVWISSRIAGTFHSKVSLVSIGLSHISTTLDPGWYGPLLITIRNNTNKMIKLRAGESFVTLLLYRVSNPTRSPHWKQAGRTDIILPQIRNLIGLLTEQPSDKLLSNLNDQTESYINKVRSLVANPNALEKFRSQVEKANRPMRSKVMASVRSLEFRQGLRFLMILIIYAAILFLLFLPVYWDGIKGLFHNIPYDSKIFVGQVTAIIALISLLISLNKK